MFHELIYTSAPRGLAAGTKGFTTVASTPDMPKQLTSLLESLSGYRHLHHPQDAKAHLNPIAYSFLTTKIAGAQHFILSRVADAGLDYSQRTNKLAHHLAQPGQPDIPGGPAWLAAQPGFFQTQWTGDPRLLPANRPTPGGTIQPAPCNAWKAAMGDAGWGGILAESLLDSKKAGAYLIVPTGLDLLSLIREAQALLPAGQRWKATFSTFFTKLPPNVDCRWRCVLEGTPEAASARRAHDRLLIDLTKPPREKPTGSWADAARNGTMPVADPAPPSRAPALKPSSPAASPSVRSAAASQAPAPMKTAPQAAAPVAPATPAPVASTSTSGSPAVTPGPPPPIAPQASSYDLGPPSLNDPYQPADDEPTVRVRGSRGSNPQSQRMLIVMASVVAVLLLALGGVLQFKNSSPKNEIAEGQGQQKEKKKQGDRESDSRNAADKLADDKLAADKLAADKLAADKLAADKVAAEKVAAEKVAAEKAAEKLATEKLAAYRALDVLKLPLITNTRQVSIGEKVTLPNGITQMPYSESQIKDNSLIDINGWKITKQNGGKEIAVFSDGSNGSTVKFLWRETVTHELAKQVAAGTIQINDTRYRFELPAATVVTTPDDPPTTTPTQGPQKLFTLGPSKLPDGLPKPKNGDTNEKKSLGKVTFDAASDSQHLKITLHGLKDLAISPPPDTASPDKNEWNITRGTGEKTEDVATISLEPDKDSKNDYLVNFQWKINSAGNSDTINHLKTGILKFHYENFQKKGEAKYIPFSLPHTDPKPKTIELTKFKSRKLNLPFPISLTNQTNIRYECRLVMPVKSKFWPAKGTAAASGSVKDIFLPPRSNKKTMPGIEILTVPASLTPSKPASFKINRTKMGQLWPRKGNYVTARFTLYQADNQYMLQFFFWGQKSKEYKPWQDIYKHLSETKDIAFDQTNKKIEAVKKPLLEKQAKLQAEKKPTPTQANELAKIKKIIDDLDYFKDQRKNFQEYLNKPIELHLRITTTIDDDLIILYQAGNPD